MVPIISVVGKTDSGKTTLIEKLVPELKKRGYRVGTIKHDVHQFEFDHKGKDTWRMAQSGADTVVISSVSKIGMVKKIDNENSIDGIAQWLLSDVDIIITEGYKKENKPKIEITRTGELLCSKKDNLIAIINNMDVSGEFCLPDELKDIPCFRLDDIKNIIYMIEEKFLEPNKK